MQCQNPSQKTKTDLVKITDMLGRQVMVPKTVKKIIGIRSGALRQLIYMDAAHLVIGVEDHEKRATRPYLTVFPELKNLPSIGPKLGGDAELILKAGPDVIFFSYTTPKEADALQKKTGIPVVAIVCPELTTEREKLFDSFRLIGEVLQKKERADTLIHHIQQSIDDLNTRTKDIPEETRPTVYIGGVAYKGPRGICSTQPYYPPFVFANAQNVASNLDKRLIRPVKGAYIDMEQLLVWNPDHLFLDVMGAHLIKKDLERHPALQNNLDAFKNKQVHPVLPFNNCAMNYEQILINGWIVGKTLYPKHFKDISISTKTDEILKLFLGPTVNSSLFLSRLKTNCNSSTNEK